MLAGSDGNSGRRNTLNPSSRLWAGTLVAPGSPMGSFLLALLPAGMRTAAGACPFLPLPCFSSGPQGSGLLSAIHFRFPPSLQVAARFILWPLLGGLRADWR